MYTVKIRTYSVKMSKPLGSVPAVLKKIFADLDADQEHFVVLGLSLCDELVGFKVVATGSQDACLVDPRLVFRAALILGAAKVVVAHNHPSGCLDPSDEDLGLTERVAFVGDLLGIPLVDHVIIARGGRTISVKEKMKERRP